MYLKSIEIYGFKSFANRVKFDFEHGITGIVGPNGSGKSNVADAVRWVLGEKSARQLRSERMEDVIFSGTQVRKPMSCAYVAITLNNEEQQLPVSYDEVTVARRVYRSGESEYLLNGSVCRRKDIVELFFDTGIGKEGYSIIGQGQVEAILSGKPEERRELFDEAAGIIKYKRDKLTAQRSLEREREHLTRINDILLELEDRVQPLQEQAAKAKEYLQYRDHLRQADIQLFLLDQERMEEEILELSKQMKTVDLDLKKEKQQQQSSKEKHQKLEKKLYQLRIKIDELIKSLQEQKVEQEKLEGRKNVLKEQIKTQKTKEEHYTSNVSRIEMELEAKQSRLNQILNQISFIEASREKNKEEEKKERLNLDGIEQQKAKVLEEIEQISSKMQDAKENKVEISGKMTQFATIREQLNIRISDLEEHLQENKKSYEGLFKEQERADDTLQFLQKKESKIKQNQSKLQLEKARKVEKLAKIVQEQEEKKNDSFRLQSHLEALQSMVKHYEGYGNSIRKVMKQRKKFPGILGVVADIMKVDKKYEIAIETALGGKIQNIVTDEEETAKQMIAYLKENRLGRATFLPLDAVSKKSFPEKAKDALEEEGVLGLANELVRTEPKFEVLVQSLLGRILVVENIDVGIALARKYKHSLRIVTLEGEYFHPGGSIAGGAFKNSSNLLARNREILETKKACEAKEKAYEEVKKQREEVQKEQRQIEDDIRLQKQKEQECQLQLHTFVLKRQQLEARSLESKQESKRLQAERANLEAEKAAMEANVKELLQQQTQLESLHQSGQERQEFLQKTLQELSKKEEQHVLALSEYKLQENSYEQQMKFSKENKDRAFDEVRRLQYDLKEAKSDIAGKENLVEELEQKIKETKERGLWLKEQISKQELLLEELQTLEQEKTAEFKQVIEKREHSNQQISVLDKHLYRLQSQQERVEAGKKQSRDYMWETYQLTVRAAKQQLEGEIIASKEELKREVSTWKSKMKQLGSININAMEEYKKIKERYDFLNNQQQDIVKAEAQLVELIGKLEKQMQQQFLASFQEIQGMFNQVFRELFGGGHAKLKLLDEGDLLNTGILIIAQPPGKKLQNMMQLSGGEKTLTAISLLFAIQRLKPSPFCLLDEIEAALDDSNVGRFNQYLHKLTKDTQFIVITHRKGTMTAANTLYGITMQEKGISAMVSVKLIEDDLDN